MKMTDEESLLKKMGATVTAPDAGCCGMAGPFGFEARKFDVSMAIGERVLLPAVRNAPSDTLIVSDGFSCREQIQQATGRRQAVHLAEAIRLALEAPRGLARAPAVASTAYLVDRLAASIARRRPADRHCLANPKLRRRAALRCRYGPRDASTLTSHFVPRSSPSGFSRGQASDSAASARIREAATVTRSGPRPRRQGN